MKLTDHLTAALVKVPLVSTDKNGAITELVDLIAGQGLTRDRETLLRSVLERETQRTTGIGRGFAIPHAKCDAVDKLIIALGRASKPIDFASVDGKPVELMALLASPTSATSAHIQALAKLSRLVTNGPTFEKLLSATSSGALFLAIQQCDSDG
jgi:fructose-specific phosphotransferase system IIA component